MNKLKNAPLQEVIFEARWEPVLDPANKQWRDEGFKFALGKFQESIADRYPLTRELIPTDFPEHLLIHKPLYQFWSGEGIWPVLQIGPGVFTLNDTEKNYEWERSYKPALTSALEHLDQAYARELNFVNYSLRYIDVVKVGDYAFGDWASFVAENLNFRFENQFDARGALREFNFQQVFDLEDGSGLRISISNGKQDSEEPVFIWQTAVLGNERRSRGELLKWVTRAHDITSDVFKDICKKDFYASFSDPKQPN